MNVIVDKCGCGGTIERNKSKTSPLVYVYCDGCEGPPGVCPFCASSLITAWDWGESRVCVGCGAICYRDPPPPC